MGAVDRETLFELGGRGKEIPFRGEQTRSLIVVLGATADRRGERVEERLGFFHATGTSKRTGAVKFTALRVVTGFQSGGEGFGGIGPPLKVFVG